MSAKLVYKIATRGQWRRAEKAGVFEGAPVDLADGYIHLSTATQVRETASRHFAGQSDLVLVAIPEERIAADLHYEPSRGGELFPHLRAPLQVAHALWVEPLRLGREGEHEFPASFGGDAGCEVD